jgi:hypothetical protein
MSGLVRGKIECVLAPINRQDQTQEFFTNLYSFFSNHPNYTVIALQYGSSAANLPNSTSSGTGTNYYNQANSFGYNAFFVVRANATAARPYDVYYLFQWGGSPTQVGTSYELGASPGNPALAAGYAYGNAVNGVGGNTNYTTLIVQAAIGIGGTGGSSLSPNNGNPWKGTSNVNGADTKSAAAIAGAGPVWGAPSGGGTGVMIFPRSCDGAQGTTTIAGTYAHLAQDGGLIYALDIDTQQTRMSIVGDDDSWCLMVDYTDNGNYYMIYSGLYVPRPNTQNVELNYPFVCLWAYQTLPMPFGVNNQYAPPTSSDQYMGGICNSVSGTVNSVSIDHYANNFVVDTNFNPDHQMANLGTVYNEWPIWVGQFENYGGTQLTGYLGQIVFIKEMYNVNTNDTKSDFSRIFIGSTTLAQSKVSVPWDSQNNTVPRSGTTVAGVTFVTSLGGGL